jgi:alpha-soluble NSF attachment protein
MKKQQGGKRQKALQRWLLNYFKSRKMLTTYRGANKLYLSVAELAGEEGDYYKAIALFEKVATSSISNQLLKWSVKEYLLKSGLCLLAVGDPVATTRGFEKYIAMDPTFGSTREYQVLVDLNEAVVTGDKDKFEDVLHAFHQTSGNLTGWKTTILLRVKGAIEEQGEDFS